MTIGKCNECGHEYPATDARIGYFCGKLITTPPAKPEDKPVTVKCMGVVIRRDNAV